jgi:hypothetical protein
MGEAWRPLTSIAIRQWDCFFKGGFAEAAKQLPTCFMMPAIGSNPGSGIILNGS